MLSLAEQHRVEYASQSSVATLYLYIILSVGLSINAKHIATIVVGQSFYGKNSLIIQIKCRNNILTLFYRYVNVLSQKRLNGAANTLPRLNKIQIDIFYTVCAFSILSP